jgi:hypothetical protein
MTADWTGSHLDAGDVAWAAWRRLGVEPYVFGFGGPAPAALEEVAEVMAPAVAIVTRTVLDELEVRLYGEARERVVEDTQLDVLQHVMWAVVHAVARELERPEPEPYAPPPAGSWMRTRRPARAATRRLKARPEPTWEGLWHRFTGDVVMIGRVAAFQNDRAGLARCGARVNLRGSCGEAVVVETMPGVDVCRSCAR